MSWTPVLKKPVRGDECFHSLANGINPDDKSVSPRIAPCQSLCFTINAMKYLFRGVFVGAVIVVIVLVFFRPLKVHGRSGVEEKAHTPKAETLKC